MTFYTTDEDQERHPIVTKIVGADKAPELRGIRAITILQTHEPATCSVKNIFPLTRSVIWIFPRAPFVGAWAVESGLYVNSEATI